MTGQALAFAYGMCMPCYEVYVTSSGGNWAGTQDPPAYLRNLRKCAAPSLSPPWTSGQHRACCDSHACVLRLPLRASACQ